MKRALIIPDTHIPFEDKRAYNLMLKVGKAFRPQEVVILGDYLDCYSISAHARDPNLPNMLGNEIDAALIRVEQVENAFPSADLVFLEGNHEFRLSRYIRDRAPELFGYITLPKILGLTTKRWKWIPYGPEQKYKVLNSKLYARHEPIGTSSKTTSTRAMCSVVFGHTHRIEESQVVAIDGSEFVAFSPGFLGDKRSSAFNYVKNHAQWAKGFATIYVDPKTKYFYHNIIRILDNYTCVFNGKVYRG